MRPFYTNYLEIFRNQIKDGEGIGILKDMRFYWFLTENPTATRIEIIAEFKRIIAGEYSISGEFEMGKDYAE